jgi:6-pyruvoyltetrahydropterin/6-carboxytetrahydropterin synthase
LIEIKKSIDICYGHSLSSYDGVCQNIHGHNSKIIATFTGNIIAGINDPKCGMVEDFAVLKKIMREEISDVIDHGYAVWVKDKNIDLINKVTNKILVTEFSPTAEVLCYYFFNKLTTRLIGDKIPIQLISLEWQETPNNSVVCRKDTYNYNILLRNGSY